MTMDNNQIQKTLYSARATMNQANNIISSSQSFLIKLKQDIANLNEEYDKKQAKINQELLKIIQNIDEETIEFIKNTE